jgi:hypothetical protein
LDGYRPKTGAWPLLGLATVLLIALAAAPSAFAAKGVVGELGTQGPDEGKFESPRDVAVNQATGDVYVADEDNHRVQRFSATGAFELMWGRGVETGADAFEVCTAAEAPCLAGKDTGDGPGEFDEPTGVAIDDSDGSIYVMDRDNLRIQKFTDSDTDVAFALMFGDDVNGTAGAPNPDVCLPSETCRAGTAGAGPGQVGQASSSIAPRVIVQPAAPHDVLVADPANRRVLRFNADGTFESALGGAGTDIGQFGVNQPLHLGVDAGGVLYASDSNGSNRVQRYDLNASSFLSPIAVTTLTGTPSSSTNGLKVDPDSDRLYVARNAAIGVLELDISTSAPVHADTHVANVGVSPAGLEVNATTDELYVAATAGGHRVFFLNDVTMPSASMGVAGVTAHTVQLSGVVNPNGWAVPIGTRTTHHFEYREVGDIAWTIANVDAVAGNGTSNVAAAMTLTGLEAGTAYEARLVAIKPFGAATTTTAPQAFTTSASGPAVDAAYVTRREAGSAVLNAAVSPNNMATTYRFEYGTTGAYGTSTPIPDGSAGSGGTALVVSEPISGLQPGTEYHFRVVARNATGTTTTPDLTFTTRPADRSPDVRGYELVSPADKASGVGVGYVYKPDAASSGVGYASYDGQRFAVQSRFGATMLTEAPFAYGNEFALAERTPSGWVSHSPLRGPDHGDARVRMANLHAATPNFDLMYWDSNGAHISVFPEAGEYPQNWNVPSLSDWNRRWEIVGPTDRAQGQVASTVWSGYALSSDGSHALLQTSNENTGDQVWLGGLSGPGDPVLDQMRGFASVYVDDVSAGLSDSFPGAGVRSTVGVCSGQGAGRTRIPTRTSAGRLDEQACPPPLPGRDEALISPRGASLMDRSDDDPRRHIVSSDGSRIFFMSPDGSSADTIAPCSGTGAVTACPPQLYVRQTSPDGTVTTRWISRPESAPGSWDASLLGPTYFEGASSDGDKVYFRTTSPLTADDPNGQAPVPGGVTTGAPSENSWDLYLYDFPDAPGADPGDGTLTRVSAGPLGVGDCNSPLRGGQAASAALRFVSDDGRRAYFTCAAALPGVLAASNGTITTPGGTPAESGATNLYYHDARESAADRWRFVARLPRAETGIDACATTKGKPGEPLVRQPSGNGVAASATNCMRGMRDGSFITFMTKGRLTADDPDSTTGDLYAYDAARAELIRISEPQGGSGGQYGCTYVTDQATDEVTSVMDRCHADGGIADGTASTHARLGVATQPSNPDERIAFFQSRSRLVAQDTDDRYDVYQWRDGELSLVSTDIADEDAYYSGNGADGRDVFIATRAKLTWQDNDVVMDVYDARIGGGIPKPPEPPGACSVLTGACQSPGTALGEVKLETNKAAPDGNAVAVRKTISLNRIGPKARLSAVRTGVLRIRVTTTGPGPLLVGARARIDGKSRKVGGARKRVAAAGVTTMRLRLSSQARRVLRQGRVLRVTLRVAQAGARARRVTFRLGGPRR